MKKYSYPLASKIIGLLALLFAFAADSMAQPCQTIIANITSTSPATSPVDTTTIKICKGTTVSFTGSGTFSGSGTGATYQWKFNDGTIIPGTSASMNFPNEGVYVVDFVVTDANGCVNKNCNSRRVIQVSTTPHFDQIQKPDTICMHQPATIFGVVTPVDGIYNCAPPVSDTTYLPDGNGTSYTTDIDVSCFTPCDTVASATDIESICLNIEHSFVGDLIASIECPNGQTALLFDGNPGGGNYLGAPNDISFPLLPNGPEDNVPGVGATYCFTTGAALGILVSAPLNTIAVTNTSSFGITTAGPSIAPGTYAPEGTYNSLIGCPLNGSWTLHITDDAGQDNGYIFNWGITFSQNLGNYSFTPTYPQQSWAPNPDIIATANGGKDITIKPKVSEGLHCYTFQVVDDFNCPYDTTVCVYVVDPGNPGKDTTVKICLNQDPVNAFTLLGGSPTAGGQWSGNGVTPVGIFDPSTLGVGLHDVTYTQSKWNCDTSATITFNVVNDVVMDFSYELKPACDQDTVLFTNLSEPGQYWWNFADGTAPDDTTTNPVHIYQQQNIYAVRLTVKNKDGCIDSVLKTVDIRHPLIAAFNRSDDSVCQTDQEPIQFTDVSTGNIVGWNWDFGDGTPGSTLQNPAHQYTRAGLHQVRLIINDKIPCYDTIYHTVYVDSLPFLELNLDRYAICVGEKLNLSLDYLQPAVRVNWVFADGTYWSDAFGETAHSYDMPGTYWVSVKVDYPVCAATQATDSVVVKAFPVVYLGSDSVLCLDGPSVLLSDLNNANNPAMNFRWSTGETTPSIRVVHPGTYSVTVSEDDCATTEDVVINKDCYTDIPNAFTPNGDGDNDYFYPRQLLSKGVASFTMSVFNRWGQKVFETSNPNGRGWDGKFNEKEQPLGVYVYQIKVILKNGKAEEYSGNVTLIK